MSDEVVILVCDDAYLNHAKALMVNFRLQGNYEGDFAVICPIKSKVKAALAPYGIEALEVDAISFFMKFYVFDEFFKKWAKAFYSDCDVIIQGDTSKVFAMLGSEPTIPIWMDQEGCSTLETFCRDREANRHLGHYRELIIQFPHVLKNVFNSGLMLFNTGLIPCRTVNTLIDLQNKYEVINSLSWTYDGPGTDQQIINLLLHPYIKPMPDKLFSYYAGAGNNTVALHYCRWKAPWVPRNQKTGGPTVPALNKPCYEVYSTNLSLFDKTFRRIK